MDHFPIPTFPPDEWVWVRLRKICVEYKGQKEKVARSPSPHSIFFMSFSLLHISEVSLFTLASETWTKLPEKQIHCEFFPIFLHVNDSKTVCEVPPSPPASLLYPIIFTSLCILFIFSKALTFATYWWLFIIHYMLLNSQGIILIRRNFHRGSMEYIFCTWIWVCVIEMTFYKL